MKSLNLKQMEVVEAGGCAGSLGSLGILLVAATFIAAPVAAGVWAAGFILGSINAADACK